jgi:Ni/Fe-hydrogenase subunit HybB-like protein
VTQHVTAWILGLTKARPGWFNAIMAPLFIVSAAVSGLALLIVSVVMTRRLLRLKIEDEVIRRLGQILLFLVPVLCYFLFAEMLTVFYGKEPAEMQVFNVMMHGPYAFLFWGHLLLGPILPVPARRGSGARRVAMDRHRRIRLLPPWPGRPRIGFTLPFSEIGGVPVPRWLGYAALWLIGVILVLVFSNERLAEDTRLGIAAGLVVLGIYAERWNIVLPSLVGYSVLPLTQVHYAPSWSEVLLLSGIYSVGGLIYIACVHLLPLVESGEEAEPVARPPERWADQSPRWGVQVPPGRESRWSRVAEVVRTGAAPDAHARIMSLWSEGTSIQTRRPTQAAIIYG